MLIHTRWFEVSVNRCANAKCVIAYERDDRDLYIQIWDWLVVLSWLL